MWNSFAPHCNTGKPLSLTVAHNGQCKKCPEIEIGCLLAKEWNQTACPKRVYLPKFLGRGMCTQACQPLSFPNVASHPCYMVNLPHSSLGSSEPSPQSSSPSHFQRAGMHRPESLHRNSSRPHLICAIWVKRIEEMKGPSKMRHKPTAFFENRTCK